MTSPTQTVRGGELARHYRDVRARLYGKPVIKATPVQALTAPPIMEPANDEPQVITGRVLNMLAPPSWRFLLAYASLKHDLSRKVMMGPSRLPEIVRARDEAIGLVYQHTQYSLPSVGRLFGGRDHSTVFHALRKHGKNTKLVDKLALPPAPPKDAGKPKDGRTPLQRAIVRGYANTVPAVVIAQEYGCNPNSVRVIAHRMGIKRRPKSKQGLEAAGL